MRPGDTHNLELFLRAVSTEKIDKFLFKILHEMRRRNSGLTKDDIVTKSRALEQLKPPADKA
jgi:hypothetical protein